jgi:DNA replication protein DnaC
MSTTLPPLNCPACGFRAMPASGCPVCNPPAPRITERPVKDDSDKLIDASVDRLLAAIDQHGEKTLARLAALPKSKDCEVCGHPAYLDENSIWSDESTKKAVIIVPVEPKYHCPACTEKREQERFVERLAKLGIPPDVRGATLDNFRTDRPGAMAGTGYASPAKFLSCARMLAAGEIRNLVLSGTVGIGKGHLGAALCSLALKAGKRAAWIGCHKLFRDYHKAYQDNRNDAVIAPLIRADLLVLDEIGLRDKLPADGEEILFEIIEGRKNERRQTVLLGNKSAEETRAWLGERIRDRLISGGLKFCFGSWESMRGNEEGF